MGEPVEFRMLVDGKQIPSAGGTFASIDPYTGEEWAVMPDATPDELGAAVTAASTAFTDGEWSTLTGSQRALLMLQLAHLIEADAERLGTLETRDNGKVIRETVVQSRFASKQYRYFAGLADKIFGRVVPLDNRDVLDLVVREPLGVCGLIIAWNSPMQLLANKLAPALAAGNTVVVKPSEHASASVLAFGELVERAGFPPGVINIVSGYGPTVGEALSRHPDVRLVSLTGGVATGRAVGAAAIPSFKKLVLELGGKSPNIVFDDADLDAALAGVMAGIFGASGQTCIAGSRLLVQESVYESFVEELALRAAKIRLGNPVDATTEMGPLSNAAQFERVTGYIESARRDGARFRVGGGPPQGEGLDRGFFVSPTIVDGLPSSAAVCREEVFGPVLVAASFADEREAVALGNDTEFGLAAGLWTRDVSRAVRVARALQAGSVWVNTYRAMSAAAPFGGYKGSGVGRERGLEGLLEYTQVKNIMIDVSGDSHDPFAIRA